LRVDAGGRTLAAAAQDGSVRLWRLPRMRRPANGRTEGPEARSPAFLQDGGSAATARANGCIARLDVHDLRILVEIFGHSGPAEAVAFSPDETKVATGGGLQKGRGSGVKLREIAAPLETSRAPANR